MSTPLPTRAAARSAVALSVLLALGACGSDDDGDAVDAAVGGDVGGDGDAVGQGGDADDGADTVSVALSSDQEVPPVATPAPGASGAAEISVDAESGAISGEVTVEGLTGPATMAHIHVGAPGEAGPVAIGLEGNGDGTVWTIPDGATLADTMEGDVRGDYAAGNLYFNVHTDANPAGEVRGQIVPGGASAGAGGEPGTFQFIFTNTSASQPMTPPVVAIHTPADDDGNGIRLFEVGQPAIEGVVAIAEDGDNAPLVEAVEGQVGTTVSAAGVAFADPENPGPLLPGQSATLDLSTAETGQVMSVVSMVVCTNDGFSGIDSAPLPGTTVTTTAPIYDAGSEVNVLRLNYWVPPCGGEGNLHDDEGGVVAAHPGQSGSENPIYDFEPGTALLEVTVTRN